MTDCGHGQPHRHRPRRRRRHPHEVEDHEGAAPDRRAQHDRPRAARRAGRRAAAVVAVVGHQREQVGPHIQELVPDAVLAVQETQDGTGHAVRVAMEASGTTTGTVIVAAGDTPLLEGETLRAFAEEHHAAQRAVSILSGLLADPFGYGRIVRNDEGDVEAIVEEKDATPEQREIAEISSGILAFDAEFLVDGAGPRSATTTPRASTTSPTPSAWRARTG